MDSTTLLKEVADLALVADPDPTAVEVARLHFLESAAHQAYPQIMEQLFTMNPTVAASCNNFFSDFLDLLPHPLGGWVVSLCFNVLLRNPEQRALGRPRLLSSQLAEIEIWFKKPCHVEPQLLHPAEIDALPWHQWMEHVQKLFTAGAQTLPLQDSGEEPAGEGIFAPYALVLHFWLTDRDPEAAISAASTSFQNVLTVLQTASGREAIPITEPVLAHRAYASLEGAQVQIELMRWANLTAKGKWIVREEITDSVTQLVLSPEDSQEANGIITMGDSFPWVHFVRWSVMQSWLNERSNVRLEQNKETLKDLEKELAEVPRSSYTPDPNILTASIVGYTVINDNGPLLDSHNNVPLALTSDQAAVIALAVKNTEVYTVAPVAFITIYMLAAQAISMIALREAYVRLQDFCRRHALKDYPIYLPNAPGTSRWVQIDPEWVLPASRRQEFEATVGRQMRKFVQKWSTDLRS